jgi:hypothetical protein
MTTFVVLVTLSVVILLATIYRYFGKKVESEFYEKLQAQKGQVEIILKNRIALITGKLDNLGADNIVKKIGEKSIVPQNYPGISRQAIDFVLTEYPNGEVLEDGEKKRVLWWFSAPIMQETSRICTRYRSGVWSNFQHNVAAGFKNAQCAFNKPWISPVWTKSNFSETQWNKQFLFPIVSGKPYL